MLNKLRNRAQDEKGFTLIELLVVILIIGILAAIALPAFLNQRGKAQDTSAKSQVRTMQTAMETWYTNEQTYTGATLGELNTIEPSIPATPPAKGAKPSAPVIAAGGKGYTITSTSDTGNTFVVIKADDGSTSRSCATGGNAGCPKNLSW
jgi:type IV pilus assembly protein PilA